MTPPKPLLLRWFQTLKFKIVAIAVVTAVVSAVGAANFVLRTTQDNIEQLLLRNDAKDSEQTAALLATKLTVLESALRAVVLQARAEVWADSERMTRFLVDKAGMGALFDSFFAVGVDGRLIARVVGGIPQPDLFSVAERPYFERSLRADRPVVSNTMISKASDKPIVVIAMAARAPDGRVLGVVGGSLALQSNSLFANPYRTGHANASRDLVIDRTGEVLAHSDPARVTGKAADEPGLGPALARRNGSDGGDRVGSSTFLTDTYLVSMADIPNSEWTLVRMTPQAAALEPLAAARRTAWTAAAWVGAVSGLLAGLCAWAMTRPISQLRARALAMLDGSGSLEGEWPRQHTEIGEVAAAFREVVEQRQQRQRETEALLQQIEAVLDHAEVGIALTRDRRFELVSRRFCCTLEREKQQVIGQSTRIVYASDAAFDALAERVRPAFSARGAFDGEVELVRGSGAAFWARLRGRSVVAGDPSQGTIWTIEDVSDAREQRERLTWSATHDALTGLANRPAFESLLETATGHAATVPFCALFIDLDHFKAVNDSGGHAAGDAMLRGVAAGLTAKVRLSDTVARIGGDEFAVLLHRCPPTDAHAIAEKLRTAVLSYRLAWEGREYSVGASIGLVAVDATFASAADVLKAADTACYEAKRLGRDRVSEHHAPPAQRVNLTVVSGGALRLSADA